MLLKISSPCLPLANLLLLFIACNTASEGIPAPKDIRKFVLNLDAPPRNRWDHILENYDGNLIVKGIEEALAQFKLDGVLKPLALKIAADLDRYVPQPYADEMRGISEKWKIDLGYVVFGNIFYDMATYADGVTGGRACTSIVTNDRNGNILHGRNLDYYFSDVLVDLAAHIEFQKNGTTLFHSVSYVGQVGTVTAFKPGSFSMTLNERDIGKWWTNVIAALEGSWPIFFYFREVMEKAKSFEGALEILKDMKTVSPAYVIVGGIEPYQGAIMIGDRHGAMIERMNNTNQHGWFVLETNYDPWTTPPPDDDRRDAAINLMKKAGQKGMDAQSLYQILSTPPILNKQTIYTTIMSASNSSIFHTVVRKKSHSIRNGE